VTVSGGREGLIRVTLCFFLDASDKALFLGEALERGYGNLDWKKAGDTGWMIECVLTCDGGKTLAAGVMTLPNALRFWRMENELLCIDADLRAGSRPLKLGGKELETCTVLHRGMTAAPLRRSGICHRMCRYRKIVSVVNIRAYPTGQAHSS